MNACPKERRAEPAVRVPLKTWLVKQRAARWLLWMRILDGTMNDECVSREVGFGDQVVNTSDLCMGGRL